MRGRARLLWRLVSRDIRRRRGQSLLLVLVLLVTTGTLTIALALGHVGEASFARTRAATRGPDLSAAIGPGSGGEPVSAQLFAPLLHAPTVREATGPLPLAFVHLTASGVDTPVEAEGRTSRPTAIDRPHVVAGSWVRGGGVVLERGLATALGLAVGDRIRLGGHPFTVSGIAVSTAEPFYPAQSLGVVWLPRAAVLGLATRTQPLGYLLELRLDSPSLVERFLISRPINQFAREVRRHGGQFELNPLSYVRNADHKLVALNQKVLAFGSFLLTILALASIAILVGGRMAEQTRRVGLLKAVGATPGLVTVGLLAETLLLSLVGALLGLLAGGLLAPSFASPGNGLLGSAGSARIDAVDAGVVLAVAVFVVSAATLLPAIRGARVSTVAALSGHGVSRRRRARLLRVSARLPAPLSLALRIVGRQTRRTTFNALGLMTAVAMVVAALTVQHSLELSPEGGAVAGPVTHGAIAGRADHVLVALSVILGALAVTTAAFTAWATVVDARRTSALARALGATPRQVSAALTTAQLLPALVATCAGIPVGLLLYQLAGGHLSEARPPVAWLIAVIPLTLLVVAGLTMPPARLSARRPVAEVLRAD